MTREEAIDILFGCIEAHSEEENEALDMAIEALSEPSGDLIRRADTIEMLCKSCRHDDKEHYYPNCVLQMCCDDINAINELPSAEAEWIPCSEKLPEKEELVLVTVWNDVVIAWRNRYGGWESVEDMYEKGDVIAWMPLPEPYRDDGEEE